MVVCSALGGQGLHIFYGEDFLQPCKGSAIFCYGEGLEKTHRERCKGRVCWIGLQKSVNAVLERMMDKNISIHWGTTAPWLKMAENLP